MDITNKIKTIESFRELNYNGWNGYDAEPISEKVINKALNLIKELNPLPEIYPTGRNSIQFEWETEDEELYLEIEIFEESIKIYNEAKYISSRICSKKQNKVNGVEYI